MFDSFDRRLLAQLATDSDLTSAELGERVGLSASAAHRSRSVSGSARSAVQVGVSGPHSVASSAARVSLSTRSARASGWRRR